MANYSWPPLKDRKVMGQRLLRHDGIEKASGKAKYTSDIKRPNMLHVAVAVSPYANARIRAIDAAAAEKMPGVKGIQVGVKPGEVVQWAGWELAFVAAETESQARDAAHAIKVDYDVLPHLVNEADPKKASDRMKPAGEQIEGDPDAALKAADVVSEGTYHIPTLQHCCLESHGSVVQWTGDKVEFNPSTQGVTAIQGDLARQLSVPTANVHVHQDHIGGGFGSKFQADRWGVAAANLSKLNGGRPVRVYLERPVEMVIGGCRPSGHAQIKLGAKKDGTITVWESKSWATGGVGGGGPAPIPYVYTKFPNRRQNHSAVSTNNAPIRAWRAPNHQQACFLTCTAIDDLAAKLGMDPMEVFAKNAVVTPRAEAYVRQLKKAAALSDWAKLWKPRGKQVGAIRRGLGVAVHTWGGAGHDSTANLTIHPDGSVVIELGSQDLGTGTRTIIAQVVAETLGLRADDITVKIGDTNYPSSGTSGGSTTVGGVSSAARKASVDGLEKLFVEAADALKVPADQLVASGGRIFAKSAPAKALTWKQACAKLGVNSIAVSGKNDPRQAPKEGLNTGGVGGVQVADVSIDIETGIVRMNKLVAVQDCGLIINPRTAESQVYGACIMSICGALMEERIMDDITGRMLNNDMEFYKLAGIKDIGEIIVQLEIDELNDKRGVIGLGEPPAIGGIAAISNAVANALGVRVPWVPVTPNRVLDTLAGRRS